jgi:hypothetical protein
MSLINSVNLIPWLKNKISTINKAEKQQQFMQKMNICNIMKIYLYNIPKTSQ